MKGEVIFDKVLNSSKPKEGDASLDEIRGNLGVDKGATLFSEVQGNSEQRTESYYTYDEGVVAGDNTEIHKKSAPKSNGEVSKVDRQDSTPKTATSPFYFSRGGYIDFETGSLRSIGFSGYQRSSTASINSAYSYYLYFDNSRIISSDLLQHWRGFSAR